MSKWIPGIGNILTVSSLTLVIFGLLALLLCFASGTLEATLEQFISEVSAAGISAPAIPSFVFTFLELYLWIGAATFVASGITSLVSYALPSTIFFYVFTILAGFIAGLLLFWRKPNRIINSFLAPLFTALYITITVAIASITISSIFSSIMSDVIDSLGRGIMPASMFPSTAVALDATGYVLVFFITYGFITIGTFLAALLWELIYWGKEHGAAAAPKPTPPQAPAKPAPKPAPKPVPKKPVAKPMPKAPLKSVPKTPAPKKPIPKKPPVKK